MALDQQGVQNDAVKMVDEIIHGAINEGASDIHFEPQEHKMFVRFRVDGSLKLAYQSDLNLYKLILSRLKVMAGVEITGLPRPQEGNIKVEVKNSLAEDHVDLRVSIFPTVHGEAVVIRVLEASKMYNSFVDLGLTPDQLKIVEGMTHKPYGLVLVTGPTGSGKSTTLFTLLNALNEPERSLVTLEDPVERKVDMVRQTQIDHEAGVTFASGLRYLLRQDPDIIMVGEIRDTETANISVQAAVTGHLVLATIHTNNAAGAIVRLINMGVEPFLLSSSLKFVSAQRLALKLCSSCKKTHEPNKEIVTKLGLPRGVKFYKAEGCEACNGKGTRGRIGVHEILMVDEKIENLIMTRPSDEQINIAAIRNGMTTLRQAALIKAEKGDISLEEVMRLTE